MRYGGAGGFSALRVAAREPAAQGRGVILVLTARLKPCPDTCMVGGCGMAVQAYMRAGGIAFLPTFAAELVPGLDLFLTWTAAVFFATRQLGNASEPEIIEQNRKRTPEPEILDPGPAPARRV
jgi:hypothetical protein